MSYRHASVIVFDGCEAAAKKRIAKLRNAGYVRIDRTRLNNFSLIGIGSRGLAALQDEGLLEKYPTHGFTELTRRSSVSPITLRHELNVLDTKSAFAASIRNSKQLSLIHFMTWPRLSQFEARPVGRFGTRTLVKPDASILIHRPLSGKCTEARFFLELDRSTETQDKLVHRLLLYSSYYRSGDYAKACGGQPSAFRQFPFRVLVVVKSVQRRDNLLRRLFAASPPILSQVLVATLAEVTQDPLGPVWMCAGDLRSANLIDPRISSTFRDSYDAGHDAVGKCRGHEKKSALFPEAKDESFEI